MKKQLEIIGLDRVATIEPYAVPRPRAVRPATFTEWQEGKKISEGDWVTIVHRLGRTKRVKFAGVYRHRVRVIWPLANEALELSLKTGRRKRLADWSLEPNALAAAREWRRE